MENKSIVRVKKIQLCMLAVWFDRVLCGQFDYFQKAKGFRPIGSKLTYWYITDVRQDGFYPCHPYDDKGIYKANLLDGLSEVEIVY